MLSRVLRLIRGTPTSNGEVYLAEILLENGDPIVAHVYIQEADGLSTIYANRELEDQLFPLERVALYKIVGEFHRTGTPPCLPITLHGT